jgi:hypothetical protein
VSLFSPLLDPLRRRLEATAARRRYLEAQERLLDEALRTYGKITEIEAQELAILAQAEQMTPELDAARRELEAERRPLEARLKEIEDERWIMERQTDAIAGGYSSSSSRA